MIHAHNDFTSRQCTANEMHRKTIYEFLNEKSLNDWIRFGLCVFDISFPFVFFFLAFIGCQIDDFFSFFSFLSPIYTNIVERWGIWCLRKWSVNVTARTGLVSIAWAWHITVFEFAMRLHNVSHRTGASLHHLAAGHSETERYCD